VSEPARLGPVNYSYRKLTSSSSAEFASAIICAMTADHRLSSQGKSDPSAKCRKTARGSLSPGSGIMRRSSRSILVTRKRARNRDVSPSKNASGAEPTSSTSSEAMNRARNSKAEEEIFAQPGTDARRKLSSSRSRYAPPARDPFAVTTFLGSTFISTMMPKNGDIISSQVWSPSLC
jgi:hypothetical protein